MAIAETTSMIGLQGIFGYLGKLQMPSRADFVEALANLGPFQAVGLALAGIVFLIYGFKCFKAFVLIDAALLGAMIGGYLGSLGQRANLPLLMGLGGALILSVLAWFAMKYAVGVFAALAGGLLGFGLWYVVAAMLGNEGMLRHSWAGGLIGIVALGLLAFVSFRPTVMIFTSLQGAVMIVSGACSVLMANNVISSLQAELVGNDYLLCVLVAVPAAGGFFYQFADETTKIRKKRKDTEKPPV